MDTEATRALKSAAARESWARTEDRAARTANGRKAAMERFAKLVDPDGTLDPAERHRRAEAAKRAYFTEIGRRAWEVRRARDGAA